MAYHINTLPAFIFGGSGYIPRHNELKLKNMLKLNKVNIKDSKYAWSHNGADEASSFVLDHSDTKAFTDLGLLRITGDKAWFMATPILKAAINPQTKASVGNRVVGIVEGGLADKIMLMEINGQMVAAKQAKQEDFLKFA